MALGVRGFGGVTHGMLAAARMALYVPLPLEPAWQALLAHVAPRTVDPRALAVMVSRLSRRYLGEDTELARGDERVARVRFYFARDVQKIALPIAELVAAGALAKRPLRVLDLGAGIGASSAGVLRTLTDPVLGADSTVAELHLVDRDAEALGDARALFAQARRLGLLPDVPSLETRAGDLAAPTSIAGSEPFDLVLIGNALVETTRAAGDEPARGAMMASIVAAIIDAAPLAPDGSVVIIEPATRVETRALHHARAALLARGLGVFAPCTHRGACPMLARERDWCHEDLPVDLPEWLVPVAQQAGLHWQGLSFAELVVRRDARSVGEIATRARAGWVPVRVVSAPRETKGKTEAFVSGALSHDVTGARVMQLDREVRRAKTEGTRLSGLARGDLVAIDPTTASVADGAHPLRVGADALAPAARIREGRTR